MTTSQLSEEARQTSGLFAFFQPVQVAMNAVLDLVYPPTCGHCQRVDYRWCPRCMQALRDCPLDVRLHSLDALDEAASTGGHEGILRDAVHSLKYGQAHSVGEPLGQRLHQAINILDWTFDTIIPVPLHETRLKQRRYNQAKIIGDALSKRCNAVMNTTTIYRQRDTRSQVGLTQFERQTNVQDAFLPSDEQLAGKRVLIIDDVRTTGATLNACATAVRAAGATTVYGLSVSRAVHNSNNDTI